MTKRDVARLSCRIFSIYTLSYVPGSFGLPLSMLRTEIWHPGDTPIWLLSWIPSFLLLLFSVFLWFGAGGLSARMISGPESSESSLSITPEVFKRVAFSVAGMLILMGAVSPLRQIIQEVHLRILGMSRSMDNLTLWLLAIEVVIRMALGAWLIFGSEKIRRLLQKARPLVDRDW